MATFKSVGHAGHATLCAKRLCYIAIFNKCKEVICSAFMKITQYYDL